MANKKYEKLFDIRTSDIREWPDGIVNYNRCESTPYKALDILFKNYKVDRIDRLIDFGSGSGRVAFYIHNRFKISVTGIEGNINVYEKSIENLESYIQKAKNIEASIEFKHLLAEYYKIQLLDNLFYFFNPFSVEIFQEVIYNILRSVEENQRKINIIIYYPMDDYIKFLKNKTPFNLLKEIKVPDTKNSQEKFLIYSLS